MSWLGFGLGLAAGEGLNRLRTQSQINQALDLRHYQPVMPPLPVERWVERDGELAIGVPSGWRDLTSDELFRMSTTAKARVGLGICATDPDPRLGCSATSLAVLDQGPQSAGQDFYLMFVYVDEMVRARVEALPEFSSYAAPSRIALGGQRAIVHHMIGSAPGDGYGVQQRVPLMQGEVFVVHGTTLYAVMFSSPPGTYESYLPHFWTMLGNWRWLPPHQ